MVAVGHAVKIIGSAALFDGDHQQVGSEIVIGSLRKIFKTLKSNVVFDGSWFGLVIMILAGDGCCRSIEEGVSFLLTVRCQKGTLG